MEKTDRHFIADLKGYSGCQVKLYNENGAYFVRKISSSVSYNERLEAQMTKQMRFNEEISGGNVTAPKVMASGLVDDLFFFDMEFVRGVNLVDHINKADINELSAISKTLCNMIQIMKRWVICGSSVDFSSETQKKVDEILSKMVSGKLAEEDLKALETMRTLVGDMDEWNGMQVTFCHGDLTMENIIYNNTSNKYHLIDFLDNYIDHYWFDIVKLFQDIEGRWYQFRNPTIRANNIAPKMTFIKEYINKNLLSNEKAYREYHYLLLALTFARILPYAESQTDTEYLMRTIKTALRKYDEGKGTF